MFRSTSTFYIVFLLVQLLFYQPSVIAQSSLIYGKLTDSTGKVLPYVNVSVPSLNKGTVTSETGKYELALPAGKSLEIQFSLLGYVKKSIHIVLSESERKQLDIMLKVQIKNLQEVAVIHQQERISDMTRLSIKEFEMLPNPSGSLESMIKTLPGVSSANELSAQYSVRGGNFDENLVYVNDMEIIRPFLIRSGEQEGLSFINSDLVEGVRFSAGGFEAKYGDKMSSVLDVSYRTPMKFGSNISLSLMGGSVSAEGVSKNSKFSFISGVRYKTTKLLLGSLDSKGEYEPNFTDWQMLMNYKINNRLTFSLLTNYARNAYTFIPQSRETVFGTFQTVYNLKVYYDGREDDQYNSLMGGLTTQYTFSPNLSMKLIVCGYSTFEQEKFDIQGEYLLNELDAYSGSSGYGDSILNIGVGGMLNHARNYLQARIWSGTYSGNYIRDNHSLNWSLKYQHENFKDYMSEWNLIDSAGYSSPYSENQILLNNYAHSENNLITSRITGHIQDELRWESSNISYSLNAGIRFQYWSLSKEKLLSPRVRFSIKPDWQHDIVFYVATGIYYQPPFYKEMRDFTGMLNMNIRSQKSYHFLTGIDYQILIWGRSFKYTCEMYYKYLDHLIPYKIDNVRVMYTAKNDAIGYATGLDMKLYGEFVPGVESWASLSLLSTKENIKDDYYIDANGNRIEPGYYPRPTDQLFHMNIYFQDYLPHNPSYKVSLNLVYGTSFYWAPPQTNRFDLTFPSGPYRRVDLGLSKIIKIKGMPQIKSLWIGAEIFNLLDIKNIASFMWVQTVGNQENVPNQVAVPNYLTTRRLNVKLTMKF